MDISSDQRLSQFSKQFGSPPPSRGAEPMIMGSPSSPHPGAHNTSQYLPGYLLGDQTPTPSNVQSPVVPGGKGLWSSSSGGGPIPRLTSQSTIQSPQAYSASKKFTDRIEDNITPCRSKDKLSAPPVSGLLDTSISTPSQHVLSHHTSLIDNAESKHQLTAGFSSPLPHSHQHHLSLTQMSHSTPAVAAGSNSSTCLISPPQVDPFYTQGEELSPHDMLDESWVTVFGFAQGAAGHVLQQFNEYGTILEHVISNDGNWMHLHYKSKIAAKKALSKNGKITGNNMMVGVRQCIDQAVMRGEQASIEMCEDNNLSLHSVQHVIPLKTLGTLHEPASNGTSSKSGTPIRPLTKAYQPSSMADVSHSATEKGDTWWKKAMEYAFGW